MTPTQDAAALAALERFNLANERRSSMIKLSKMTLRQIYDSDEGQRLDARMSEIQQLMGE